MSACVRPYDTVGRYGGEEFLIVVPSSDASSILSLAERIRISIESHPMAVDRGEIRVTASLGVEVCNEKSHPGLPTILRLCDEALYLAKRQGRNRSEMAAPETAIIPYATSAPIESGS